MKRLVLAMMAAGTLAGGLAGLAGLAQASGGQQHTAMAPFCVVTSHDKGGPSDGLCVWLPGTPGQ